MLHRLRLIHTFLLLGCLHSASPAPLLEGECQDLLRLGAEATYKAQWESLSFSHSLGYLLDTLNGHLYWLTLTPTYPQAKPGLPVPFWACPFCFLPQAMDL